MTLWRKNIMEELEKIIAKFANSGWDLIETISKEWLAAIKENAVNIVINEKLIKAVEQADNECGSCGCEYDPLYKRALVLLRSE